MVLGWSNDVLPEPSDLLRRTDAGEASRCSSSIRTSTSFVDVQSLPTEFLASANSARTKPAVTRSAWCRTQRSSATKSALPSNGEPDASVFAGRETPTESAIVMCYVAQVATVP